MQYAPDRKTRQHYACFTAHMKKSLHIPNLGTHAAHTIISMQLKDDIPYPQRHRLQIWN